MQIYIELGIGFTLDRNATIPTYLKSTRYTPVFSSKATTKIKNPTVHIEPYQPVLLSLKV